MDEVWAALVPGEVRSLEVIVTAFGRLAVEGSLRAKKPREIDEALSTACRIDADAMLDEVDAPPDAHAQPDG